MHRPDPRLSRIASTEPQFLAVFASGAKQSRGRRLRPLDCFAPLAKTAICVAINESPASLANLHLAALPDPATLRAACRLKPR
jgi:hypothetical protein